MHDIRIKCGKRHIGVSGAALSFGSFLSGRIISAGD